MGRPTANSLRESVTKANIKRRASLLAPDQFAIGNKDPDRAYRFISKTMLEKSGGFDRRGWIPITAENSKGETLETPTQSHKAGTDKPIGDLVLAWMPKEIAEENKAALKAMNALKAGVRDLKEKGISMNIPVEADMEVQRQGITENY